MMLHAVAVSNQQLRARRAARDALAPFNNLLITCENTVVQQRVLERARLKDAEPKEFVEELCEFGGCRYRISSSRAGGLVLSFSLPELGAFSEQVLNAQAMAGVAAAYKGIAALLLPPEPPFHVCLDIDTRLLVRLSPEQQELWARNLASVRVLLVGHPLREQFKALEAGTIQPGPALCCCNIPGQIYFVKPGSDSVSVVFPVKFGSRQDGAIGVAFLQEFAEARRAPGLGRAPSCTYYPPGRAGKAATVPGELAGVDVAAALGSASGETSPGGFLVFVFVARHVSGPQQDAVVWAMATMHHFISHHVKASKTLMHSRMRRRVESMLAALGEKGA